MKIIHTADWHLGNRMHDIERSEEFKSFLVWLKEKIIEENAEGILVAGDIFDTAIPPTESRKQYIQFLASLLNTCCKNVILIGGNHDSGALLDSEKDILEALNIHVVGSLSNLKPEEMVFEMFDKDNKVSAICAAVPFARENELRNYFNENVEDGCFSDGAYSALYGKVYEAAEKLRAGRDIPVMATGHLYAANLEGRFENCGESENNAACDDGRRVLDVVGKLGSVHVDVFPKEFDYVALGHIHYATTVAKNTKVRYSGSPFTLGYDEAHLPRHILSVDVEKGVDPVVQKIEVPKTVEYRRLSGDCKTIRTELEKYRSKSPDKNGIYCDTHLELYYKREDGINIHDELEDLINELKEKQVYIASRRVQETGKIFYDGENSSYDMEELKNLSPEEIFKALLMSKYPIDLGEKENLLTESEKEKLVKEKQQEIFDKYLPLFMETFNECKNLTND